METKSGCNRLSRLAGTAPGPRPSGILVAAKNVTIAGNRFSQMEEGIRWMADDPVWGTLFGVADDVQVIDNRFCDVANPINTQPQAAATEQGTLLCPFPGLVLDIASAVLLSERAADVQVESAQRRAMAEEPIPVNMWDRPLRTTEMWPCWSGGDRPGHYSRGTRGSPSGLTC